MREEDETLECDDNFQQDNKISVSATNLVTLSNSHLCLFPDYKLTK